MAYTFDTNNTISSGPEAIFNAGTTPPTYRIWRVADTPDYDASQYNGPYSGASINFSSISIIDVTEVTN